MAANAQALQILRDPEFFSKVTSPNAQIDVLTRADPNFGNLSRNVQEDVLNKARVNLGLSPFARESISNLAFPGGTSAQTIGPLVPTQQETQLTGPERIAQSLEAPSALIEGIVGSAAGAVGSAAGSSIGYRVGGKRGAIVGGVIGGVSLDAFATGLTNLANQAAIKLASGRDTEIDPQLSLSIGLMSGIVGQAAPIAAHIGVKGKDALFGALGKKLYDSAEKFPELSKIIKQTAEENNINLTVGQATQRGWAKLFESVVQGYKLRDIQQKQTREFINDVIPGLRERIALEGDPEEVIRTYNRLFKRAEKAEFAPASANFKLVSRLAADEPTEIIKRNAQKQEVRSTINGLIRLDEAFDAANKYKNQLKGFMNGATYARLPDYAQNDLNLVYKQMNDILNSKARLARSKEVINAYDFEKADQLRKTLGKIVHLDPLISNERRILGEFWSGIKNDMETSMMGWSSASEAVPAFRDAIEGWHKARQIYAADVLKEVSPKFVRGGGVISKVDLTAKETFDQIIGNPSKFDVQKLRKSLKANPQGRPFLQAEYVDRVLGALKLYDNPAGVKLNLDAAEKWVDTKNLYTQELFSDKGGQEYIKKLRDTLTTMQAVLPDSKTGEVAFGIREFGAGVNVVQNLVKVGIGLGAGSAYAATGNLAASGAVLTAFIGARDLINKILLNPAQLSNFNRLLKVKPGSPEYLYRSRYMQIALKGAKVAFETLDGKATGTGRFDARGNFIPDVFGSPETEQ